jgi:hypothetical protein
MASATATGTFTSHTRTPCRVVSKARRLIVPVLPVVEVLPVGVCVCVCVWWKGKGEEGGGSKVDTYTYIHTHTHTHHLPLLLLYDVMMVAAVQG